MRKPTLKITYSESRIEIDFSEYGITESIAKERIERLKPLFEAIFLAESDISSMSNEVVASRLPAISAQDLVYQYRVYEATEAALLLHRVTRGQANIADHGFPEIGSGFVRDV